MTSENQLDIEQLSRALEECGKDPVLRRTIIDALREAEVRSSSNTNFQQEVRWPILLAMLANNSHIVTLSTGLKFEVTAASRIEKCLLLSQSEQPDHVWEPQTTKLLIKLASMAIEIIVGGAYIGDHCIPMARATAGRIHAFEPMSTTFEQLCRNIELNAVQNIVANKLCLWDQSDCTLALDGPEALATTVSADLRPGGLEVSSVTIDDYVFEKQLARVDLIMLDTEGGEARALEGATSQLKKPADESPEVIFEVHRNFVDWSNGLGLTEPTKSLLGFGYEVFAIRDIQGNLQMADQPIEIIPLDSVYLPGPPHGFNLFATKKHRLISTLGLEIVENVSPKLIQGKDPSLHHPVRGWP